MKRAERRSERAVVRAENPVTTEEGLAYHAFLQYVEFGKGAEEELARMREQGLLSTEQSALLDAEKLKAIVEMPSLKALAGKRVMREQTFLVSVPAREIPALNTTAQDEIVIQGAIDLLCEEENGYTILDYKFSSHDDGRIREDYRTQLLVYKKAVAKATGCSESDIRTRILNILRLREIEM